MILVEEPLQMPEAAEMVKMPVEAAEPMVVMEVPEVVPGMVL